MRRISEVSINTMEQKERRLAAIMFTDIVGYSSIMQRDEETANLLRARHREVFDRLTAQYGGRILQYFGDGTLSIFPSAAAAVECGVAIQLALKKEPKVPIRIGIHTGDVTFSNEEAYGDGVNIAARIESICVPGGVFISGKVYDDIKNHSRLRASSIGTTPLKNINQNIEIFAVTNSGLTVPEYKLAQTAPGQQNLVAPSPKANRKNKIVAAFLALFFGIFGVHRFYLDQRKIGIAILTILLLGTIGNTGLKNFIPVLAILGFVDAIIFFSMSKAAFNEKYNKNQVLPGEVDHDTNTTKAAKDFFKSKADQYREEGERRYKDYDYNGAIESLLKSVELKYDDPETHFLLSRCLSLNEETEQSLHHLNVAIALGFKDFERINHHPDLAYLRVQKSFEDFVANGYRLMRESRGSEGEEPTLELDLLQQLNQLRSALESGKITLDEYEQKARQLRSRS